MSSNAKRSHAHTFGAGTYRIWDAYGIYSFSNTLSTARTAERIDAESERHKRHFRCSADSHPPKGFARTRVEINEPNGFKPSRRGRNTTSIFSRHEILRKICQASTEKGLAPMGRRSRRPRSTPSATDCSVRKTLNRPLTVPAPWWGMTSARKSPPFPEILRDPRLALMLALGFSSGLPFLLDLLHPIGVAARGGRVALGDRADELRRARLHLQVRLGADHRPLRSAAASAALLGRRRGWMLARPDRRRGGPRRPRLRRSRRSRWPGTSPSPSSPPSPPRPRT